MIDYDKLAQDYQQHRHIHPEVLKTLLNNSDIKRQSRILEIGCGTGNYIIALYNATKASSWAIDPSEEMLDQARKRSTAISFQQGQAEALQFENNFFDFLFSVDVIHHLRDVVSYFTEAFRILGPGGKICTVTDSEDIIRTRRPLAFYFPETIGVDLKRYPSIFVLRKRMEQTGFREIQQIQVAYPYQLTEIEAYKNKVFSCLSLISDDAYQRGLARMEKDLLIGPIQANSQYSLLWGTKKARIVYL